MAASDQAPNVNSIHDLMSFGEAFSIMDGKEQFKYSYFCFLDSNNVAYFGTATTPKLKLTGDILRHHLKPIPDQDIYPEPPAKLTIFSHHPAIDSLYIKHPALSAYNDFSGSDFLARLYFGEVETLELLREHAHPNIVAYHGCILNRGRITGIVLDRHKNTLKERCERGTPHGLNKDSVLADMTSAINHLHSLGLAHNDLNPANVMIDKDDRAVVIDFGSCRAFGQHLQENGTRGWIDEYHHLSKKVHDETALAKIEAWMKEQE